ncbi:MAG: methyltransferase domain-containing protein [Deltaproteobacteria bacterium]|nr:methyltransferase domain-containing protein [Deltaproteobacteria bacterium]
MKLTNRWNQFIYRLWSPVYDSVLEKSFRAGRERSIALLDLKPGERVLLVGVGTGIDLPLLPPGVRALGVDLTPAMLARALAKLPLPGRDVVLQLGDAQSLPVKSGAFDAVILHLILAVVPDGAACLREALRALRPGGRAAVFDKFLPKDETVTMGRKALNVATTLIGTDINRRFEDLARGADCEVVCNEPSVMGGVYRVIQLRRR